MILGAICGRPDPAVTQLEVTHHGRRAVVRKNTGWPPYYLWIDVDDGSVVRHFFLGCLERGMTRGDVRRMARERLTKLYPSAQRRGA